MPALFSEDHLVIFVAPNTELQFIYLYTFDVIERWNRGSFGSQTRVKVLLHSTARWQHVVLHVFD